MSSSDSFIDAAPARGFLDARWGLALCFLAAVLFAFKGVLVKLAFAEGIGLAVLMFVRFALAAPMFWGGFRSRRTAVSAIRGLSRADWGACLAAGACYFVSVYTDFKAISLIPVGVERLLFFSYPIFILILTSLFSRTMPTLIQLAMLVLIEAGLALVVGVLNGGLDGGMLLGAGYALAAAFSYSLFLLLAQVVTRRTGSTTFTIIANTFTFIMVTAYFIASGPATGFQVSLLGFAYVFAMALFCTVIPFFLLFEGIRRVGSTQAALISTLGPVVTVLASNVVLGETLTLDQWLGMGLVVLGVAMLERRS